MDMKKIELVVSSLRDEIVIDLKERCKKDTQIFADNILGIEKSEDEQAMKLALAIDGKFGGHEPQVRALIEIVTGKKLPITDNERTFSIDLYGFSVIVFTGNPNSHNYGTNRACLPGVRITSDFQSGDNPCDHTKCVRIATDAEIDEFIEKFSEISAEKLALYAANVTKHEKTLASFEEAAIRYAKEIEE